MTKKKKAILIIAIVAIAVLAAAAYYFLRVRGSADTSEAVYVQKVSDLAAGNMTVDRYSGVTEAQQTTDYKKDSSQEISEVYVKVGDTVAADTPLFKYDVSDAENQIATINLDIEGLNNDIAVLQESGDSTDIKLQISEKQIEIKQKQAEIASYQKQIDQSVVKASFAGVVKSVNAEGGFDQQTGSELPVVSVTQIGDLTVKGQVSEQTIGALTVGMDVIIRSRVDESKTWKGTIAKIDTEPSSDNTDVYYGETSGESSSKYPFYVTLESTDGLMLGQHVFIEPDYGQGEVKEGLWLDMSFIVMDEDGNSYVWADNNGKLEKRSVTTGETDDENYTVQITDGLSESDKIAFPDDTLREGMKTTDSPGE